MNIYFIRHGDSESPSLNKPDFNRKLTASGEAKIRLAAEEWKNLIPSFDYIVSSPYIRAFQTAKIIAEVFNYGKEIIVDSKLASGNKTEHVVDIANSLAGNEIAFIGHEPDISMHISNLTSSSGSFLEIKKGSIAKIAFGNRVRLTKGTLEFLIPMKAYK